MKLAILALLAAAAAFPQSTIQGQIAGPDNKPIPDITITATPGNHQTKSTATGAFTLTIPPGQYLLTATGRGYLPAQQEAAPGDNVTIKLNTLQTAVDVREPLDDFLATASVSISKSPEAILNSPYAIQVLPKALFDDRAVQDVKSLYRNISGLTDSAYSAMTFRGFTQREVLFNGVRGNPYGSLENDINDAGFSTSQGRLSNVEFVEVLKGPAAVLFGAGEAGGVVNFVTKKPRNGHSVEAGFRTGSFAQKGGSLDLSGPINQKLFYRAAWFQEDRRLFRYNSRNENSHLATGLAWRPKDTTSLSLD